MRTRVRTRIGAALCAAASLLALQVHAAEMFQFALLGDNPYPPENVPRFEQLIEEINADAAIAWVIHVGDIIGGGDQGCADELLRSRRALYDRFHAPFLYTPGDNEWFDCGKIVHEVDDYERLDFLRKLFFPQPGFSLGPQPMPLLSQSSESEFREFVENVRWQREGVVFALVHLVQLLRPDSSPARAELRTRAALAWIEQAFAEAERIGARGLFLAMQANPWMYSANPGQLRQVCPPCVRPTAGLEAFYPLLEERTIAFGKPVVLAVGDTHIFRVDKPLYSSTNGRMIPNFTRVEVFGDPDVHWVRVLVDPTDAEVFRFDQEILPR